MPRRSQSQKSSSPSTNRKRKHNQTLTQTTLEQSFRKSQKVIENLDELVNKCVRYVIYRAGTNLPIRKLELQKHVLQHVGRNFEEILTKAGEILKNVYGYDLYLSDEQTTTKQYLVSNTLPYKGGNGNMCQTQDENEPPSDVNKILIMLVLSHIFMSNNIVTESSLFSFLRSVQIEIDEEHELFGNVKDFVTQAMVKQKYLTTEIEQPIRRISYLWGPRAEHEISKHALLKFVCKMFKDRNPKSWTSQFENANAQSRDEAESVVNGVDVAVAEEEEESD